PTVTTAGLYVLGGGFAINAAGYINGSIRYTHFGLIPPFAIPADGALEGVVVPIQVPMDSPFTVRIPGPPPGAVPITVFAELGAAGGVAVLPGPQTAASAPSSVAFDVPLIDGLSYGAAAQVFSGSAYSVLIEPGGSARDLTLGPWLPFPTGIAV